jgi:ABC-type amino acid transport system permease subunit
MNKGLGGNLTGSILLASILGLGVTAAWIALIMSLVVVMRMDFLFQTMNYDFHFGMFIVFLLPSPALATIELLFLRPLSQAGFSFVYSDFGKAVLSSLLAHSIALLFVCLFSLALAAWCHRRHLQYSQQTAAAWALFVMILGLPGLIGYLLHRRWPATEFCANCHKISPRDRDACLHCGTSFPPPAPKGIEICA